MFHMGATDSALAALMRDFDRAVQMKDAAKVNLIPFNPFPGTRFQRPSEADIRAVAAYVHSLGGGE